MKETIQKYYPNASKGEELTIRCISRLKEEYQFDMEKTILATSVCSDEVIRSATNFRNYTGVGNPFSLGGLGGFPFAGITGFGAFAGHIPTNGFAIILYGPHIGFSNINSIGRVRRMGQEEQTTCCGALAASLEAAERESYKARDHEYDYQQFKLEEAIAAERDDISRHPEPLIAATEVMYRVIDQRIKTLLDKTADLFRDSRVALVGGIYLNTDFGFPDWFDLREFSVRAM